MLSQLQQIQRNRQTGQTALRNGMNQVVPGSVLNTPTLNAAGNYGYDPVTGAPITDEFAAQEMLNPSASTQGIVNGYMARGRTQMEPRNNGGPMAPVGETPYTPGMSGYKRTGFRAPIQSGRSRLDPSRIAGKMARGTARPGEVAAVQLMQGQEDRDARMPIIQAQAQQAEFQNSLMADPAIQEMLRKRMMEVVGGQGGAPSSGAAVPLSMFDRPTTSTKAPTTAGYTAQNGGLSPRRPSALDAAYASGGMTRPAGMGTRAEGGEMEMEGEDGDEDAYLLGEEGPEMVIKRDDGSMFVLPADVTEKIMAGISMEDTEDNQDAMASAMQRMGMEPKMCGGKMKPRMNGGAMMAKETGRMAPGSRTKTRKNVLFDAMKRLV